MTASNAGLDLVAVSWGFRTEEELKKAGASIIIKHPLDLLNYLN
jgi:phosphoglycolate phosphatase-like HAD superfamily hydrolase